MGEIRTVKYLAPLIALLVLPVILLGDSFRIDGVDYYFRVPKNYSSSSKIMVLFGGRNWRGDRTLKVYNFNALADQHSLFLLSPSFKDRNYWEPQEWSGKSLQKAITKLSRQYRLKNPSLLFYGYSAGGQCVALFYQWMPQNVMCWGIHACGVYPDQIKRSTAPGLITCGVKDAERFQISRHFIYRYREHGGKLLWKYDPRCGHELTPKALYLAKIWFNAHLSGKKLIAQGEDDTMQIRRDIPVEFQNPIYSKEMLEVWQK